MVDLIALGARLRLARERAGLTQEEAATALGYGRQATVSTHENGGLPSKGLARVLEGYAQLYGTTREALEAGNVSRSTKGSFSGSLGTLGGSFTGKVLDASRPARQRMAPRAYQQVYDYLDRMELAGVGREAIEEAERLFTRDNYGQLYSGKRELTEEEQLQVVEASWKFIRDIIRVTEGKQL